MAGRVHDYPEQIAAGLRAPRGHGQSTITRGIRPIEPDRGHHGHGRRTRSTPTFAMWPKARAATTARELRAELAKQGKKLPLLGR